jgi:hypothetical protein
MNTFYNTACALCTLLKTKYTWVSLKFVPAQAYAAIIIGSRVPAKSLELSHTDHDNVYLQRQNMNRDGALINLNTNL